MRVIQVKVKPNAKREMVSIGEDGVWTVAVTATPTDGKANQALIKLLAQHLGVAKSKIRIKSGQSCRLKRIEIGEV